MKRAKTEAVFEKLYESYYRRIVAFLIGFRFDREEARELAQDVFVRVYRNMRGYREEAEWAYLETAARRVALNELRRRYAIKRAAVKEVSLEALPYTPESVAKDVWAGASPPSAEENLLQTEVKQDRIRQVKRAITDLPPTLRRPLQLRLGGKKYREIGKALGISMDTVKSRLHQAKKQLVEQLGEVPNAVLEDEE